MVKQYSGRDCKISFLGSPVLLQSIKYDAKQEKKKIYTMGQDTPISSVTGKKEFSGEMVMLQSEFERLVASLPEGEDPLDIAPFEVVIVYINKQNLMVTDIMKDVEFTGWGKEMKNEDDSMSISMPISIGKIVLNSK